MNFSRPPIPEASSQSRAAQMSELASGIATIRRPASHATAFRKSGLSCVEAPHTAQPRQVESQREPTPEERSAALAYQREQEAILAPTGTSGPRSMNVPSSPVRTPDAGNQPLPDVSQILARSQAANPSPSELARTLAGSNDDYGTQNMQARKEAFLSTAGGRQTDDYLRSIRAAAMSRYEIKAGWEIPAVLEQSLNSDLPGELKALVTSNVYDTATGMYLLIPQGSRLIGQYDSRVSYGQDGVQVAWSRIIFPDASAIDLNGMVGLDSHGNAGLRDKGRSTLPAVAWLFGSDQHVHCSVRDLPAAQPERPGEPQRWPNCGGSRRTGTESDGCPDHSPKSECTANHQGPGWVQIHRARKPRHPLRVAVRIGRPTAIGGCRMASETMHRIVELIESERPIAAFAN